jgi:hypothetical protein
LLTSYKLRTSKQLSELVRKAKARKKEEGGRKKEEEGRRKYLFC